MGPKNVCNIISYEIPRILYEFLMQLVLLNVSNNKLKSLPESVGSCFSLEELQADGTFKLFAIILPNDVDL